ncbi:MAG: sulfatase [Opitutaceae bacterium]
MHPVGKNLLILVAGLASLSHASVSQPPNVVLIVADDLNSYAFYGTHPQARMPHMDDFRNTAVTFDLAYCAAPACAPSRASMLTGRYPHSTGQYWNGAQGDAPFWENPIFTPLESLPETFRRNGYTTWGAGKLQHARWPDNRERAAWDNYPPHGGGFGPFVPEEAAIEGDRFWGAHEWTGPDTDFPDVVNTNAAIEFLEKEHDKPFFMMVGLWRPHTPFTAPKRFFDLFDPDEIQVPPPAYLEGDLEDVPQEGMSISGIWGKRWLNSGKDHPERWRRLMHGYLAATAFADWSAGRVIEALDVSPYGKNTIVIFWSDNGFHMGEKDHFEKCTLWEAAAQTPLAIRMPGRRNAGTTSTRPVNAIDFFPTLVDLCGLQPPPQELEGQSLRPLLENPTATWDHPALTTYGEGYFSARDERFRYIRYPDHTEELYDHQADPDEFRNLANDPDYQAVKERLRQYVPKTWARNLGGRRG